MRAIKREDLENINYYQVPKWLMDLFIGGKISQGGFKTYVLMYDRLRLSSKKGWIDKTGEVYIRYSYDEMQSDLDCSRQTVSNNLKDLEKLELIDKKRGFNSSSTFYLNIYSNSLENFTSKEDCTSLENLDDCESRKLDYSSLENLDASKNNFSKNNFSKNKKIDTSAEAESLDQEKIKFIQNMKDYIFKVEEATGKNKEEISRVINPSLMKNYNMELLLKKIDESKFLSGKTDTKPKINNFCSKNMIDKILIGFYEDRETKKIQKNLKQ
ncbi:replication initiator protein A, partial [Cetobacterium sp.]|uniref:replication initiator protein A n=1 Tax=Cetobacterium sp. TaxID=2071632 RepID=UPI003F2AC660